MRGTVVQSAATPHSYIVETSSGKIRRNRHHLTINPEKDGVASRKQTPISEANPELTEKATIMEHEPIMTRSRTGTPINPPERLGLQRER